MTTALESEIIGAIADTLVARTSLIPTATLTVRSAAGSSSLTPSAVTGFLQRGYCHFFDDTGEPMAPVDTVTTGPNHIALNYAGYGTHGFPVGLQHDHEIGALIATNIMLHRPLDIDPMLRTNQPVIAIFPRHTDTKEYTYGTTISPILVRIQIHMALKQFDADPMDPEAYNQFQQEACRNGLKAITDALDSNRHLMATYNSPGNHANGLGDQTPGRPFAQAMWDVVTDVVNIPQAIGVVDVIVRPRQRVR